MDPKQFRIQATFTQPYVSYNPFYNDVRAAQLEAELDRLDAVDVLVDEMDEYPDATRILAQIRSAQ